MKILAVINIHNKKHKVFVGGIIDDAEKFRAYMGQKGVDHFIADGSHEIPYGASYDDIINILTQK